MTHTSTEQPEALRLAECLEKHVWQATPLRLSKVVELSADELRRLHARVQELEASQARVPLSDEQITDIWMQPISNGVTASEWRRSIASAIEAAHGITQEKQG